MAMVESLLPALTAVVMLLIAACVLFAFVWHHRKGAMGNLNLTNRKGVVETTLAPEGAVLIAGELWRACSKTSERVERGQAVHVCGARGHLLIVTPEA